MSVGMDASSGSWDISSFSLNEPPRRKYAWHEEPEMEDMTRRRCHCFAAQVVLFLLGSFSKITFNFITLASCAVGVGGWAAFYFNDVVSDLPLNLFTFAIIFPLSFLIQYR